MFKFIANFILAAFASDYKIKITNTGYIIYYRKRFDIGINSQFLDWNKIRKYKNIFSAIEYLKDKKNEMALNTLENLQMNSAYTHTSKAY
jgi:hypothetical protein